jgi:hypothetical protein
MDDLREQIELLERSANLSSSIDHVQKTIDMLTAARAKIAAGEYPPLADEAAHTDRIADQIPRRHP